MARFRARQENSGKPGQSVSLDLNIWRIIGAEQCTLLEVQTVYNYTDLLDYHEFLNYREYLEDQAVKKANREAKK